MFLRFLLILSCAFIVCAEARKTKRKTPATPDTYLVVGCARGHVETPNPYDRALCGIECCEHDCQDLPGRLLHLETVSDAETWSPKGKLSGLELINIQSTTDERSPPLCPTAHLRQKGGLYLPNMIRRLGAFMHTGAIIVIDHIPCYTYLPKKSFNAPGVVEPDLINPDFKDELLRNNPFHALLDSYMVRDLMERRNPIFAESAKMICDALPIKMAAYKRLREEYVAFLSDPNAFERDKLTTSLLGVILADYFVRSQQDAIKAFMETNGFQNVDIEFITHIENGRRNFWQIRGMRNSQAI